MVRGTTERKSTRDLAEKCVSVAFRSKSMKMSSHECCVDGMTSLLRKDISECMPDACTTLGARSIVEGSSGQGTAVNIAPKDIKADTKSCIYSVAIVFVVTNDANSCLGMMRVIRNSVETFPVTVCLQACSWYSREPRTTSDTGPAVLTTMDERI